jgi:hypothetical protein
VAIHRTEVAVFIGPLVPDAHTVILEIFYIGITGYEPQEFIYDGLQMKFLGCQKRESLAEVKAHLMAEDTLCACTCTVRLHCSRLSYTTK